MSALAGRVAIVTGGSSGIGRATALALGRADARVVVVGRDSERLQRTTKELERTTGGRVLGLSLDVRSECDTAALAEQVLAAHGRIDILVACAGVGAGPRQTVPRPVAQLAVADWDVVVDTNVRGTFLSDRAVLPTMIAQGEGDIVHLSSAPAGIRGQPLAAAYCASKFAVNALSESLSSEVREHGIRVHLVFPGLVETPLVKGAGLAKRFGSPLAPERVADFLVWLLCLPRDAVLQPSRRYGSSTLRGWS